MAWIIKVKRFSYPYYRGTGHETTWSNRQRDAKRYSTWVAAKLAAVGLTSGAKPVRLIGAKRSR